MFYAWKKEAERLKSGEITKEEYDHWQYTYPQVETERAKMDIDKMRIDNK